MVGTRNTTRFGRFGRALLGALLVAAGLPALMVGSATPAAAATACDAPDKTWDRDAGTDAWNDATNWNPDGVPGTGDHVCITAGAPGTDVLLSGTAADVLSVESQKPLQVTTTLTVTDTGQESVFGDLDLDGTLSGAGDRQVDGTLLWSGSIEGAGETVVPAGGSVTVDSASANLDSVLRTDGSVVFSPSGTLRRVWMFDGTWVHGGSLTLGDAHEIRSFGWDEPVPHDRDGHGDQDRCRHREIWVPVDNDGTITATDGTLDLGAVRARRRRRGRTRVRARVCCG